MEQNSQLELLEAQIRECYGRVVYTHKTQEKCADILKVKHDRIKCTQLFLSAVTTTGILVTVFGDQKAVGIGSAILSFGLTILTTYVKQYDLGGLAQKHAEAAIKIWNVRELYLSLLTDLKFGVSSLEELLARRNYLQETLFAIYKGSPRTISKAYNAASKALKEMEETTFSDSEIDKFLPEALRKSLPQGIKKA